MTDQAKVALREQLETKKAELVARVDKIKADIARGLEADSKEQAGQLENREVLDAIANEATAEIDDIRAALARMEDGSYGVCSSCGEVIDERRLAARPYAVDCINCAD